MYKMCREKIAREISVIKESSFIGSIRKHERLDTFLMKKLNSYSEEGYETATLYFGSKSF